MGLITVDNHNQFIITPDYLTWNYNRGNIYISITIYLDNDFITFHSDTPLKPSVFFYNILDNAHELYNRLVYLLTHYAYHQAIKELKSEFNKSNQW